jgi:hypothetical protein
LIVESDDVPLVEGVDTLLDGAVDGYGGGGGFGGKKEGIMKP